MLHAARGTPSFGATLLIRGPSIPVWFTGDLSALGGTDACLSEPLQRDGWKKRLHNALPLASVNLQWRMLNTSDPLSINELVRCQGGWGTRPLDKESRWVYGLKSAANCTRVGWYTNWMEQQFGAFTNRWSKSIMTLENVIMTNRHRQKRRNIIQVVKYWKDTLQRQGSKYK